MRLAKLWEDLQGITGSSGRTYYRLATVTWSRPKVWDPADPSFAVPAGWAGQGGVYTFLRRHWAQNEAQKIAYVGKAINFDRRLTNAHNHFNIIQMQGPTLVSCGRIAFERIRSRTGFYGQIEDVIKFAVWDHLENRQGFESLPGFRQTQAAVMIPWCILNAGYRFDGIMPRRIVYPALAVEY